MSIVVLFDILGSLVEGINEWVEVIIRVVGTDEGRDWRRDDERSELKENSGDREDRSQGGEPHDGKSPLEEGRRKLGDQGHFEKGFMCPRYL